MIRDFAASAALAHALLSAGPERGESVLFTTRFLCGKHPSVKQHNPVVETLHGAEAEEAVHHVEIWKILSDDVKRFTLCFLVPMVDFT